MLSRLRSSVVTVLPMPWLFSGSGRWDFVARKSRWRLAKAGKRLVLTNIATGQRVSIQPSMIHEVVAPSTLRLKKQIIIYEADVRLEPLPKGYWQ